ncbi:hypothetical protein [Actinoplanes sp. TFC3]|uniref:hypothetical protein n=1 Tax=Actinoplanes sp. TFC3 TaxID=1710355 RepID=UPI000836216B|nr:hypothetical protein [Actinoplanes sp. TFC3]
MRTPLQGGLPPPPALAGAVVEIACDESGFSGTNLLDPGLPVITHASVDLSVSEAESLIAALRLSPHELKSGAFLRRPDAAEALRELLAALPGRALVHRVGKQMFLADRIVDLAVGEFTYARLLDDDHTAAATLYRARETAGGDWEAFLAAFMDLVRTKRRPPIDVVVAAFLRARDALLRHGLGDTVLSELTAERARDLATRLGHDDRSIPPPLEPLLPALAATVRSWSGDTRRQVLVVHDEQSALTADRLSRLQQALADPAGRSPLAGLVMADSRDDPRVQVADLLAGVARRSPHCFGE